MHTSTSPQYAIIASCDVAAAMMEPPGGTALVEESILEALDFRRAMRKIDDEFERGLVVQGVGPGRSSSRTASARQADWMLESNDNWHGFGNLAPDFNMLDPIKSTVVTPGLERGRAASTETGIPASIVTQATSRSTASSSRRRASTRSSSCSRSASRRAAGTRC